MSEQRRSLVASAHDLRRQVEVLENASMFERAGLLPALLDGATALLIELADRVEKLENEKALGAESQR